MTLDDVRDALRRALWTYLAVALPAVAAAAQGSFNGKVWEVAALSGVAPALSLLWRLVLDRVTQGRLLGGGSIEEMFARTYIQAIGAGVVTLLATSNVYDYQAWKLLFLGAIPGVATAVFGSIRQSSTSGPAPGLPVAVPVGVEDVDPALDGNDQAVAEVHVDTKPATTETGVATDKGS